jgi:tetratricopeptide (TPR) repeat protein
MTSRIPLSRGRLAPLFAALMLPAALSAQTLPPFPALSEVDPVEALSRYLRMLAANPRDLASLTGAGRAALAVGDANAALGFYARAEELSPGNGRIKAGLATALVQMEQPRTALKLFDEAVALGVPVGEIAADRGLAHDLNGDNRSAQADYALALRARPDDETIRRLALSLAISGDRAGALAKLDPLLRRNDGGAIRARAFVLALTGDQAGAAKAVETAMPGPQATVMANFLGRLGKLNPAQKALAVNFGYFPSDGRAYGAAELFADARAARPAAAGSAPLRGGVPVAGAMGGRDMPLTPAGGPLSPRLAGVDADPNGASRRSGEIAAAVEVAPPAHVLAAPIPGRTAVQVPARPPSPDSAAAPPLGTQVASNRGVTSEPAGSGVPSPSTPARSAARVLLPVTRPATAAAPAVVSTATSAASTPAGPVLSSPIATANSAGPLRPGISAAATVLPPVVPAPASPRLSPPKAAPSSLAVASPEPSPPSAGSPAAPGGKQMASGAAPALATGETTPSAAPPASGATTIATVDLPASSTAAPPLRAQAVVAVAPEPAPLPRAAPAPAQLAALAPAPGRPAPPRKADEGAGTSNKLAEPPKTANDVKPAAAKKPESSKSGASAGRSVSKADAKPAAEAKSKAEAQTKPSSKTKGDTKAEAAARATEGKDALDSKAKAKPAKAKTAERYWVQVASGANKGDLDRAWNNVSAKAPKLLAGKATYTAPWRASNRLLIGPFKTEDEAQAQVNKLAKAGVSGIQFTTRAGVDVEKVAAK